MLGGANDAIDPMGGMISRGLGMLGFSDGIDRNSLEYQGGELVGTMLSIAVSGAAGIEEVGAIVGETVTEETIDLFRSVGVREFESIMQNKAFLPGGNSLEGRQFAFTFDEALHYADQDLSKVAIRRATIDKKVLPLLDFSKSIDPHIFRNGVITVQPGQQSQIFHNALIAIKHVF